MKLDLKTVCIIFQTSFQGDKTSVSPWALANQPKIIIGDEPTGNLDSHSSDKVYELLKKLNREFDQTFILVTHDENMARKTDRIVRIVDGKITE